MDLNENLQKYRLNKQEYGRICDLLGREPQGVEWAIFSALWSEHCSYKSSKVHLKKLYSQSDRVLQSFGENAGIIDLGENEKVAFKMESHNHPSFIEPYQGAATGVGGILRDIFTMGARPVALANYLCFGEPDADRMSTLVKGVVGGIGGYGNCVGVPTITGQTNFHKSYNGNILVNAMAVGLYTEGDPICLSQASGPGNLVVYVGAKTGRDGVHGASMASESFSEDSESKRPTVQIGDPFYEKLLIESCIEVMQAGLVVAIQDMGAAGITSSGFEMAEKGNVGFDLDLDKVPLRDSSMTPEDILLSESQERMLLICEPDKLPAIQEIFHKWGLDGCAIGQVIENPVVRLHWHGELLTELSPQTVVENAPQHQRPYQPWQSRATAPIAECETDLVSSTMEMLRKTLISIEGGSRDWIYQQYDQRVGAKTAKDCSEPVGAIVLPSGRALAVVLGCRPHIMRWDAEVGGIDSIAYPALELAAKGFEPLAVTDCLNFGNPEKSEIMSEFVASLGGMNRACQAFQTPIISGNVSFYNETLDEGVTSTPSTGLVGLNDNPKFIPSSSLQQEGDVVVELRWSPSTLIGYQAELCDAEQKGNFSGELSSLADFSKSVQGLVNSGMVTASRVVGNFGLGYALARMTLGSGLGCVIESQRKWFAEPLYSVVLTVKAENLQSLQDLWISEDGKFEKIGSVGGTSLNLDGETIEVAEIEELYGKSWQKAFPRLS